MPRTMGERLRRFFWDPERLEAEDLEEAAKHSGATPLAQCDRRQRVTVRGTITSVTSGDKHGWLSAELSDGTGSVQLIWMGRSALDCVLPGRTVKATGCVAELEGRLAIYNPDFEVLE
ncbi:MAG: OB-fold nucleic acid binding domain-containing protein [Tessaracoccus sp.]